MSLPTVMYIHLVVSNVLKALHRVWQGLVNSQLLLLCPMSESTLFMVLPASSFTMTTHA